MTNPQTGEVTFEANNRTYILKFSYNALCMLEAETGKPFLKLMAELTEPDKVSLTLLRLLVWAGVHHRHPEITIDAAGELIPAAGGIEPMMGKLTEAITNAFPQRKETKETAVAPLSRRLA